MTSREALQCLYIGVGKAYTGRDIYEAKAVLEKNLDDFEKYEKALEIIARKINPTVIIVQNDHYCLCVPHPSPYHESTYRYLSEEDAKILFDLFGGTNYNEQH